jgi:hypothetical protein
MNQERETGSFSAAAQRLMSRENADVVSMKTPARAGTEEIDAAETCAVRELNTVGVVWEMCSSKTIGHQKMDRSMRMEHKRSGPSVHRSL